MSQNELDQTRSAYDDAFTSENKLMLEWYPHRVMKFAMGSSLLELGLGHGYSAEKFSEHFEDYTIIDGSKEIIERFRQKHPQLDLNIIHSYFEDFTIDKKYDSVMMGFILEHVDDPGLILDRFKHFLKPDGSVFITVPNAESLHRRLGHEAGLLDDMQKLSPADEAFGHKRYFNLDRLTKLVEASGYEVIKVEGIFLKPLTNGQLESLELDASVFQSLLKIGIQYPELSNAILMQAKVKES